MPATASLGGVQWEMHSHGELTYFICGYSIPLTMKCSFLSG